MFGALIRAAERWKPIGISRFETTQISVAKKEPGEEYEARIGLDRKSSKGCGPHQISSSA
jgi:hypothetical protein